MSLIKYQVKSLQKICLDYVSRPCKEEEYASWIECPLFCLPFKIYEHVEANTFYYCICELFICKKKCVDHDHERVYFCYNCKIEECNHCIVYHCDACAFEDNLKEICWKLIKNENENNAIGLYYTLNQFFTLLTCYWSFGQPDKENYDSFFDHLNFTLSGVSYCKCWWKCYFVDVFIVVQTGFFTFLLLKISFNLKTGTRN